MICSTEEDAGDNVDDATKTEPGVETVAGPIERNCSRRVAAPIGAARPCPLQLPALIGAAGIAGDLPACRILDVAELVHVQ